MPENFLAISFQSFLPYAWAFRICKRPVSTDELLGSLSRALSEKSDWKFYWFVSNAVSMIFRAIVYWSSIAVHSSNVFRIIKIASLSKPYFS